jgi:branched-chain amino acid transport system permease protein
MSKTFLSKNSSYFFFLILFALLFLLPLFINSPYVLHVAVMVFLNATLAMGWNFIARTGLGSFGHAAYAGIGAYTAVLLVTKLDAPFWLAFIGAGLMGIITGFLYAKITVGLRRIYLAISTFAAQEILVGVYTNFHTVFGGAGGIAHIPQPPGLSNTTQFYFVALILMVAFFYILYRLSKSRFGILTSGLAQSESLEQSVGINTNNIRLTSFVLGAVSASLAGCILAFFITAINPEMFSMVLSTNVLCYGVVGGLGSIPGGMVGAAALTILSQVLYRFGSFTSLIFGVLLILVIILAPAGLWGFPYRKWWSAIFKSKKAVS